VIVARHARGAFRQHSQRHQTYYLPSMNRDCYGPSTRTRLPRPVAGEAGAPSADRAEQLDGIESCRTYQYTLANQRQSTTDERSCKHDRPAHRARFLRTKKGAFAEAPAPRADGTRHGPPRDFSARIQYGVTSSCSRSSARWAACAICIFRRQRRQSLEDFQRTATPRRL